MADPASSRANHMAPVQAALMHARRLLAHHAALALEQADEIARVVPGHPDAVLVRGEALAALGRLDEAQRVLAALAAEQPRSAATAHALGAVLARQGREHEAIAPLRRAVQLREGDAPAWHVLARCLRGIGDEAAADAADLAGIRAATHDPGLRDAAMVMGTGRLADAVALLRQRGAHDIAAQRMLAEALARQGALAEASACLEALLALAPGFVAARELLARVLQARSLPAAALEHVALVRAAEPDAPSHMMLEAALFARLGRLDSATALYRSVLDRFPRQPRAWLSLGHIYKASGAATQAIAAYRAAIALLPGYGEAWFSLANLKTFRFGADDITAMRTALADSGLGDADRVHLQFALARALEGLGEVDHCFAAYAEGARLRRAGTRYRADDFHRHCRRRAALLDAAFFDRRRGFGHRSAAPIFVVGMPRSGSTLVEQILSSHSAIEGLAELPYLMTIAGRFGRDGDSHLDALDLLSAEAAAAAGRDYCALADAHRIEAKPRFIDKLPNNWQHVGLIHLILPDARIIDVRRDPMACGWSMFRQHFARGQDHSYDLDDLGRHIADYTASMARIDAALPGRVHRVQYEHLVEDIERETQAMLAYLDLPNEPACLDFHRNPRAVRTPSAEQVRQPLYRDGLDEWQRFARHLAPLARALRAGHARWYQADPV